MIAPAFLKTVAAMTSEDLCDLTDDLDRGERNDLTNEQLGFCLVEQAQRFSRMIRAAKEEEEES